MQHVPDGLAVSPASHRSDLCHGATDGESVCERDDGVTRRTFLVGAGATLTAASSLGSWVTRTSQAVASANGPRPAVVGFGDAFADLARIDGDTPRLMF